jgi:CBS domain-containing protein
MSVQRIRDVARRKVVAADPDMDAESLARLMREESVGSVVIETEAYPVGIVTDRDLVVEVLADESTDEEVFASELMTEYPTTIRDDLGVEAAVEAMDEHDVRRLPVVNHHDTLVGIVTLDDIYRELVREHEHLANVVAAESPD